jgi:cardiolipin synthase
MKAIFKIFTSKLLLMGIIIILQLLVFIVALNSINNNIPYFYIFSGLIAATFVLYIVNADINPAYKIAWIVPIIALPLFGAVAYLLFGKKKLSKKKKKKFLKATEGITELLGQNQKILEILQEKDLFIYDMARYIYSDSMFPVHKAEDIVYFKLGEEYFERLKIELLKAEKYIFLEFFIISTGEMWESILDILKDKISNGVDVRLIYDDVGSLLKLPRNYSKYLESLGLKVYVFNDFKPIIDSQLNNRTHRKIVVIDGKTAFTGGINLSDEYINKKKPLGHWKDTGVLITGSGVKNFTLMFLLLWAVKYGKEDYSKYDILEDNKEGENYLIPFSDSPTDNKNVYENAYIKMIYNAKEYVFINTPYLILDNEIKTALVTAARSGVDVRITVPHTPDKKYIFVLTKAFYSELIKQGVKVYEYLPGFIHAKSIVSDGKYSIVGTSNMDFRSFYLHFECGVVIYSKKIAEEITNDYLNTILISRQITENMTKVGIVRRLVQAILRLFAPML